MDLDIIPKEAFNDSKGGRYFIPRSKIEELDIRDLKAFEAYADELSRLYPEYTFTLSYNHLNSGFVIGWWRIEHRTEESSDPKVLPWR